MARIESTPKNSAHSAHLQPRSIYLQPRSASQQPRSVRAQAAIEVLIYLGFFMLVFVSLTVLFLMQVNQDVIRRQQQVSNAVAEQVAQDVEIAILGGPGFNATFPIPDRIAGQQYELYFNDAGYMYINLTNSNPDAPPVMFYFPLSTRRIEMASGCDSRSNCNGNQFFQYKATDGSLRKAWMVNTKDGTLHIEHATDANGMTIIRVS